MTATLPQHLKERATATPERVAMREKEYGIWQSQSWLVVYERVKRAALGLRRLGVERGDRVAILGDNRPEWVIGELATQALGGLSMGIYQDSVASEVQFLADFAGARVLIAEDQEQIDKILEAKNALPQLEHVVYYDPRGLSGYGQDFLLSFEELEALGEKEANGDFEHELEQGKGSDTAILSTTSGTTGKPKLAMLTHDNLLAMAKNLQAVDPMAEDDEFVSFLPLAWIGEQMTAIACGLSIGFPVNFPEEPETVQENLCEIGPRMMFSPPRIWENLVSEVQVKIEDSSFLKRKIYEWAIGVGYQAADARIEHQPHSLTLELRRRLAEGLCFFWIKDKLGLRRIKHAYTGGAALGPDIFRFFHALGVNLKQIYGQTEVSGISVVHRDDDIDFSTVGTPIPETEVRIADDGEILTKSPAVFAGYYNNPEATAETLVDGWLHSGDAGYFDDHGHLIVIDRAKDVMTLHDGTKFSPQFIENKLKWSPYIKEAVVFGGDWPSVTSLVTIDFANAGKWAEKKQLPYTTFTDLAQKPEVYELVRRHIERINADLPEAARITRFLLLHKELDADDAELTRTRKVRRRFLAERYDRLLRALYSDAGSVAIETEITYQDGRTAKLVTELRIETLESSEST